MAKTRSTPLIPPRRRILGIMSREYNTPKQEATSGLANPRANQVNRRVRAYVRVSYKLITSLRPALPVFHRHRCRLHLSQSFVNVRRLLDGIEGFSHPVMLVRLDVGLDCPAKRARFLTPSCAWQANRPHRTPCPVWRLPSSLQVSMTLVIPGLQATARSHAYPPLLPGIEHGAWESQPSQKLKKNL